MIALEELKKLPLAERRHVVEVLWESIEADREQFPGSPEAYEEMRLRHLAWFRSPSWANFSDVADRET